ncbi:hypothetical protein [Massilia sp. CCM 8734]|uniref:hypothetical protein n=1 Tax=Massilia sp. CCM 8734 TaxID=2609283 RepID=UPI0014213562|nr:hypothetical protein [Massilia sp. CCM 8734]NIA00867.1 hypothetical protein [Massilia sp. CCM 8734]
MKNNWRLNIVVACFLIAGQSYAANGASAVPKYKELTEVPILVFGDGNVAAKIVGKNKTRFQYLDGNLKTSERADGIKGEYIYHRDGLLDRVIFSNGIVHTAHYDDQGYFYGFNSTSGKAFQISGDILTGWKMLVMSSDQLTVPKRPVKIQGGHKEALVNLLVAADGWEVQKSDADSNSTNTRCDNNDEDAQQRVGANKATSLQAVAVEKSSSKSEETPVTNGCDPVVVITGPGGGGGDAGGGGGGPFAGGGADAGSIPSVPGEYPPGAAPSDSGAQVACTAAAYRAWLQMDEVCRNAPSMRDKIVCDEVKFRLYNEELEYCKTLR